MENERWLPVVGYEGLYEVSDLGRVRSVDAMVAGVFGRTQIRRGKILKQSPSGSYLAVVLSKCGKIKTHRIHKLVLEAFVGPRPDGCEARHFPDRDIRNNRLSNLSWGTALENSDDKRKHGTIRRGESVPTAKLKTSDVIEIRRLCSSGARQSEVASIYGIRENHVSRIVRRSRWSHVE